MKLRRLSLFLAALACAGVAATAAPAATQGAPTSIACKAGYYENVSGHCVKRPSTSPKGATAKCRDGTYSYSEHASGTCSHHGGVARWIHHP